VVAAVIAGVVIVFAMRQPSTSSSVAPTAKKRSHNDEVVLSAETKALFKAFRKTNSKLGAGISLGDFETEFTNLKVEYDEWSRGPDSKAFPAIRDAVEGILSEMDVIRQAWRPYVVEKARQTVSTDTDDIADKMLGRGLVFKIDKGLVATLRREAPEVANTLPVYHDGSLIGDDRTIPLLLTHCGSRIEQLGNFERQGGSPVARENGKAAEADQRAVRAADAKRADEERRLQEEEAKTTEEEARRKQTEALAQKDYEAVLQKCKVTVDAGERIDLLEAFKTKYPQSRFAAEAENQSVKVARLAIRFKTYFDAVATLRDVQVPLIEVKQRTRFQTLSEIEKASTASMSPEELALLKMDEAGLTLYKPGKQQQCREAISSARAIYNDLRKRYLQQRDVPRMEACVFNDIMLQVLEHGVRILQDQDTNNVEAVDPKMLTSQLEVFKGLHKLLDSLDSMNSGVNIQIYARPLRRTLQLIEAGWAPLLQ
jgi:hypothetical protein